MTSPIFSIGKKQTLRTVFRLNFAFTEAHTVAARVDECLAFPTDDFR